METSGIRFDIAGKRRSSAKAQRSKVDSLDPRGYSQRPIPVCFVLQLCAFAGNFFSTIPRVMQAIMASAMRPR